MVWMHRTKIIAETIDDIPSNISGNGYCPPAFKLLKPDRVIIFCSSTYPVPLRSTADDTILSNCLNKRIAKLKLVPLSSSFLKKIEVKFIRGIGNVWGKFSFLLTHTTARPQKFLARPQQQDRQES